MAALWPDKGGIGQDGHLFAAVSDRDWALGGAGAAHQSTGVIVKLLDGENSGGWHRCKRVTICSKVKSH